VATSKKPVPLLVRAKETTPPSVQTGGRVTSDLAPLSKVEDGLLFTVERPADGMSYQGTFLQIKNAVLSKSYAMIYTADGDDSSPQAKQTTSSTATLLDTWVTDGLSSNMTASASTGRITATVAGVYEVDMSISFSATANKIYEIELYHDDISASPTPTKTGFELQRKMGTNGDVGCSSITGLVELEVGDSVMAYMKSADGGTAFVCHYAQMKVTQV